MKGNTVKDGIKTAETTKTTETAKIAETTKLTTPTKTIVALDFSTEAEVFDFLKKFNTKIYAKVGMELFYACGSDIVKKIRDMGHDVFLDLKLHDIPNTVKGGMKNLTKLGISMINVHCLGGSEMMRAAVKGVQEGIKDGADRPLCIGVTQLTSTSKEMMNTEQGIDGEVADSVINLAKLAKKSGLDGVVCSVHEAKKVHEICGDDFITVTPGIRLAKDAADDQKRVATPTLAREQGSDFIVVGRSITRSREPQKTYMEIEQAMW